MAARIIGVFFGTLMALVIGLVFSLILGLPTMLLWNWLIPSMFGVKSINLLQATGLLCLGGLLFDGGRFITSLASSISNVAAVSLLPPAIQSELKKPKNKNEP